MRKYFGTDGIRGKVGESPITVDFILKIGNSVGKIIDFKNDKKLIIVGQDTRSSCDLFKSALSAGLAAAGTSIIDLGVVPTPVLAYMVKYYDAAGGVMITASHNSHHDNGIKFFSSAGTKLSDETENEIEAEIKNSFFYSKSGVFGTIKSGACDVDSYVNHCLINFASKINYKHKVIVDCANGASSDIAKKIFTKLNIDHVMIASEPNGININYKCGSVHIEKLSEAVIKNNASLGIAFDGDGDRIILVDENGKVCDGDDLLYILSKNQNIIGESKGIVGTSMTNIAFENAYANNDITFKRSKVGDRYVMEELHKNKWYIGGESSGHIINLHYNTTGDGIMAALQILAILSHNDKPIVDLLNLSKTPHYMLNISLTHKLGADDMSLLFDDVIFIEKKLENKGRVLLRPSGTEPILRVMVEAPTFDIAKNSAEYLAAQIKTKLFI